MSVENNENTQCYSSLMFKKIILNPKRTQCLGDSFHVINPKFSYENKTIKTKDDINLRVSLVYPKRMNDDTKFLVICHCSSVNRGYYAKFFEKYNILDENICVLLIDYREFGNSEGYFSKKGVIYDLLACTDYFYKRFSKKFTLIGSSLGSGIILEYCNYVYKNNLPVNFDKVILLSCFISIIDLLKESYPWKLKSLFPSKVKNIASVYDFDLLKNIKTISKHKILILHGLNDNLIKAEKIKRLVVEGNTSYEFFNEDHFSLSFSSCAWKKIFEFLNE